MRGAIGVRVDDGLSDRVVTAHVQGLKFSTCADGGHKAASFTMTVPRGTFTMLGPADKCYFSDTRTGMPLFEGYVDAPTSTLGPNGETYEVSALGGMVRATDETRNLLYVSRITSDFNKHASALESSSAEQVNDFDPATPEITPVLRVQFNPGSVVTSSDTAWLINAILGACDMGLGAIQLTTASGKNDSGYRVEFTTGLPQAVPIGFSGAAISVIGAQQILYVGTDFSPAREFGMRLIRTGGATNIADEFTWSIFADLSFIGQRVSRTGTPLATASGLGSAASVRADQVVEDLLGRLLRFCDPLASVVGATSHPIDQLAYSDGATAGRVLDDLSDYEPNMLWEILHSTPQGHIFNYRPWPTMPRYEISARDGYSELGSDADLCNRVVVTWTDAAGNAQTTIVTANSVQYPALQALESTGRVRDAEPISLPAGLGSLANAQAVGAAILADSAGQETAARATISRPLRDLYTGSMVMPWEIQAGHLVQVRELGKVLRLTEQEYTDDNCSAALTLGYPSLTRDQRIAALSRA